MKHLKLFFALFAMLALGVTNAWGAALGSGYEKVTNISSLTTGDRVVVYADAISKGVTGWNGSKDATVAESGWVEYLVEVASGGVYLKDSAANNYIASPGSSNQFKYGTKAVCSVNAKGVLACNSRYLYNNGTYYRMYADKSSDSAYKPFYVYKVVADAGGDETEDLGDALKWSATSATVQMGADDNEYPTLTNDKNVDVIYSSESEAVATIDANGVVTLVKEGTTTISAFYEGGEIDDVTYSAKNVSYTLTVKPAPLVIEPIEGGIIDILTHKTFAATSNQYTNFTNKQATNENHSDAVYAGKTARNGNATQYSIQLNTIDKGRIATTTSGGIAKRVYVKWSTQATINTNARELYIYGSNTAFTGSETTAPSTKIGAIKYTTGAAEAYVDLTGDYKHIFMTGSGAIYMDEIQVTWVADETPEVPTVDAPTFDLEAGTYNEEQEVTLSAEEGTIYYTLDGTTPTADSEEYTAPIVLDECGEITIKAIAISGETTSSVASATYTIKLPLNNSQANPYTEAEAIEVYNGGCYDDQMVYVKGVVANAQFYSSNTYTITLEGGFLFYYFYEAAGDTQFTENYIETGDTLVACGKLDNYKGTYQLAKGCYLVERKAYSVPKVDISNTPETAYTVAEAIALIDNVTSDLTKQVYVKGEISEVESFNGNYGNITYWIQDEEGNKFECYGGLGLNQEQFTSIDDLVVGSQVVVYGTMKKYNSIYEFNHSNYIVSLTLPSYTVTVTVNDEEFGSVQGLAAGGKYEHGTIATLTAVANDGYEFINWTVNDEVVSEDASIQVEVISDWNVVANFDYVYETVCFINTKEWDEVWVYVWNEDGNNGWPGMKLEPISTFYGYDVYGVAYPLVTGITNVIFNNGNNGEQTDNLEWTPNKFYMIDGWYTADELNNLPFTVTGSSTSLFGSEWDPTNTDNDMVKQADGTTYRLVKENVTLAAGNIEYKVAVNHSWAWFTYPEEGNVNLNIPVSGRYNVTFTLDLETAEVTATAELLEEIVVLPAIAVKGAWDGWAKTTPFVLADDNATASVVITISTVGDYEFGINVDGQFTANGAHVTRDANDVAGLEGNSGNMLLSVDEAGDYTFTWTYATKTLVITFPTVEPEVPTALDNIDSTVAPVKAIVNGQLIIIKNGVQYNAQGAVVK